MPAGGRRRLGAILLILPAIAAFCFLFVYPMIGVAIESVTLPSVGVDNYVSLFTDGYTLRILVRTFWVALVVAIIDILLAFPYAYMMTICGPRWAAVLMTVILIPFWSNATAKNFGLLVLFQRDGLVDGFLSTFGVHYPLIGTTLGVMIAMIQVLLPFAVLPLYARMSQINRRLLDAAQGLGATRAKSFWRIYVPLSMPGLAASFTLVFILALGFYVTPAMLGTPQESLIAQLIMARLEVILDFGGAGAIGVFLLVATLAILGLSQLTSSRVSSGRSRASAASSVTTIGGVR
jgi:putative spermidine/putrescine transport system permease protein